MSTPVQSDIDERTQSATMYAPRWAREAAHESLCDAPAAAAENALAASAQLRRTLPPATQLGERRTRWREGAPFEGDLAIVRMRERPTLDPVGMPAPPPPERGARVLGRVAGAVALAALAAFFMVSTTPISLHSAVKAEGDAGGPSFWSRLATRGARQQAEPAALQALNELPTAPTPPAALADRFAAATPAVDPQALPTRAVQTIAVSIAPPPVQAPPVQAQGPRSLEQDEIATLYRRSQDLVAQGDIAGGRLLLTRAAEAGDARSALALGATFDPAVLGKLAVLGVKPDREKARAWYARAAELGSGEAARRMEQLAQSSR